MILIIDDDDDVRDSVRDLLLRKGYTVRTASNGRDALDLIAAGAEPCVVLLDLVMPVMDGWQFLSVVRADPVLAQLKVVVLSAHAGTHAPATLELLRKPFELQQLYDAVARHCGPPPP